VGPRAGLDAVEKSISCPVGIQTSPSSPVRKTYVGPKRSFLLFYISFVCIILGSDKYRKS
jgi:hypothetical protein